MITFPPDDMIDYEVSLYWTPKYQGLFEAYFEICVQEHVTHRILARVDGASLDEMIAKAREAMAKVKTEVAR